MAVNLDFGNSIVDAYHRGSTERQNQEQLAQQKLFKQQELEQQAQRIALEADRQKAETVHQNALLDLARQSAAQAAENHKLGLQEAAGKAQQTQLETGQTPAGFNEVTTPVPYAFKEGGTPQGTGEFVNKDVKGLSFKALDIATALARSRQLSQPKTEAQIALKTAENALDIKKEEAKAIVEGANRTTLENERQVNRIAAMKENNAARRSLEEYRQGQENFRATTRARADKSDTSARIIGTAHDNNALTRDTVVLREAAQVANKMNPNEENGSQSLALIYAFAKAEDPGSTVKEGEAQTAMKFAQSWKARFGFDVNRVLNGSEFLEPAAKTKLIGEINRKATATGEVYNDYRKNIINRINKTSGGKINGEEYLGLSPADFGKSAMTDNQNLTPMPNTKTEGPTYIDLGPHGNLVPVAPPKRK